MQQNRLKFRVWDNLKKEWLIKKVYHFNLHINDKGIGEFTLKEHPQGFTIQQFSGKSDMNGVDVYEGDILKDHYSDNPSYYICKFHNSKFSLFEISKDGIQDESEDFYGNLYSDDRKIVGNIFENPELLKQ